MTGPGYHTIQYQVENPLKAPVAFFDANLAVQVSQLLGSHGQNLEQLKQMSDELQRDEKSRQPSDLERAPPLNRIFSLSPRMRFGAENQEEEAGATDRSWTA